jgi:hypothetical protein
MSRYDTGYDKGFRRGPVIAALIGTLFIISLLGGFIALVGGTWSKTEAVEMTCVYNGGPLDSRSFRGYEEPGAGRKYQGFASSTYDVPTRLVQYRVSATPGEGDVAAGDVIDVRVKGYDMFFEPTVTFTINTQVRDGKPVACDLIEQHLRGLNATDFSDPNGNWVNRFLNERWRPVLDDVMTRELQRNYDPGDLKFNTNGARDDAAEAIGLALNAQLTRLLGNDFFCDSDYRFGAGEEACGDALTVILPEPKLIAEDETQLAKPQRAKVDADNDIAAAQEQARKASEVAQAREDEADSAEQRADAEEEIATQNSRTADAQATNDYAWCEYLVNLGQDCALVKAAESGDFPTVFGTNAGVVVPLPSDEPAPAPAPAPAPPAPTEEGDG